MVAFFLRASLSAAPSCQCARGLAVPLRHHVFPFLTMCPQRCQEVVNVKALCEWDIIVASFSIFSLDV